MLPIRLTVAVKLVQKIIFHENNRSIDWLCSVLWLWKGSIRSKIEEITPIIINDCFCFTQYEGKVWNFLISECSKCFALFATWRRWWLNFLCCCFTFCHCHTVVILPSIETQKWSSALVTCLSSKLEVIQSLSTNLNEINFYFSCCWTPKWTPSIHTVVERVLLLDCFRVKVRLSELRAPKTKYNDRPSQAVTRDRYVMCTNKRTEQLLICVSFHADIVRSKICIQLYLNIQQSFKLHKDQSIVSY